MTTEVAPFSVIDVLVGKSLGRGVPMPKFLGRGVPVPKLKLGRGVPVPKLKRSPEIVGRMNGGCVFDFEAKL